MYVITPPVNRETLHREYLRWAYEEYRRHANFSCVIQRYGWSYTETRVHHIPELVAKLYRKGRVEQRLYCDYLEFQSVLTAYYPYSYRWRSTVRWYELHGVAYRERRKKRAAKKEVSDDELQRREWKKSKSRDSRPWWSGKSRKRWAKKYSNKSHRAWERQCLDREAYDELGKNIRKDMFDPWDWD